MWAMLTLVGAISLTSLGNGEDPTDEIALIPCAAELHTGFTILPADHFAIQLLWLDILQAPADVTLSRQWLETTVIPYPGLLVEWRSSLATDHPLSDALNSAARRSMFYLMQRWGFGFSTPESPERVASLQAKADLLFALLEYPGLSLQISRYLLTTYRILGDETLVMWWRHRITESVTRLEKLGPQYASAIAVLLMAK